MPRWCLCWLAHPDSSPPASAAQHPNPAALPSIPASCPAQLSCIPDALPGSALPGHCRFLFPGLRFLFLDIRILAAKPGNNGVFGPNRCILQPGNNSPQKTAVRKQFSGANCSQETKFACEAGQAQTEAGQHRQLQADTGRRRGCRSGMARRVRQGIG